MCIHTAEKRKVLNLEARQESRDNSEYRRPHRTDDLILLVCCLKSPDGDYWSFKAPHTEQNWLHQCCRIWMCLNYVNNWMGKVVFSSCLISRRCLSTFWKSELCDVTKGTEYLSSQVSIQWKTEEILTRELCVTLCDDTHAVKTGAVHTLKMSHVAEFSAGPHSEKTWRRVSLAKSCVLNIASLLTARRLANKKLWTWEFKEGRAMTARKMRKVLKQSRHNLLSKTELHAAHRKKGYPH